MTERAESEPTRYRVSCPEPSRAPGQGKQCYGTHYDYLRQCWVGQEERELSPSVAAPSGVVVVLECGHTPAMKAERGGYCYSCQHAGERHYCHPNECNGEELVELMGEGR